MREFFRRVARATAEAVGSPTAFLIACGSILLWASLGHWFHYSDTWQLVINTGTTIITFLIVFLIQYAQNRDTRSIHLKLDELIKSIGAARNRMMDLDSLTDEQLRSLEDEYKNLCHETSEHRQRREERRQDAHATTR